MAQARAAAKDGQLPVTVLHKLGARYSDALVVLSLGDFMEWFGGWGEPKPGTRDPLLTKVKGDKMTNSGNSEPKGEIIYGPTPEREERRLIGKAQAWKWSGEMEHLIKLRDTRPEAYERVAPELQMQLGYYENAKQAHQEATERGLI